MSVVGEITRVKLGEWTQAVNQDDRLFDALPLQVLKQIGQMVYVRCQRRDGSEVTVCWSTSTLDLASNDEPEAVQIEMLAAFLVNPGGFVRLAHKDQHDMDWIDDDYNFEFREDCVSCQAEYLASAIAWHDNTPEATRDRIEARREAS